MNTITGGAYQKTVTIPLTKMSIHTPNNFEAYFGWRGIDFFWQTQTQGFVTYGARIVAKTPTSIDIKSTVSQVNKFNSISGNYFLIHQGVVQTGLILGFSGYYNTLCNGTQPQSGTADCTITQALAVPSANSKMYGSFNQFTISKPDDGTINFNIRLTGGIIDASNVKIEIFLGSLGAINEIYADMLFFDPSLTTQKRTFNLELFQYASDKITVPVLTFTNAFVQKVYNFNYFLALRLLNSKQNQFSFNCQPDGGANQTATVTLNFVDAEIKLRSFIFYGLKCPDGAYFDNTIQTCLPCPDYCLVCEFNVWEQVECLTCAVNFVMAADKKSCSCSASPIGSVCDNFPSSLGLDTCTNAIRLNGIMECVFCNVNNFEVSINNQCVCKTGYDDFDNDGICKETCGDGLVFTAQCDDGNTITNDGCSSTCFKEVGFICNSNQPNICFSQTPLIYKFAFVQRLQGLNKGKITLSLMNSISSLPFDFTNIEFQPPQTYVKLFIIQSESPLKETQIAFTSLQTFDAAKKIILEFPYTETVEKLMARIEIDYSQTRYSNYVQKLNFQLKTISSPLIYSGNLQTFTTISVVLCVGTVLSMVGLIIGLFSPKYIGLESLLTLQLIFYSQLLIVNPSKWPVGFMYLKYLKFASGYNEILKLTDYAPLQTPAAKLQELGMQKGIIENFNLNFVLLALSFLVFLIFFCFQYSKESQLLSHQNIRKDLNLENKVMKAEQSRNFQNKSRDLSQSIMFFRKISKKLFWIVNHLSVWLILPILASNYAQIVIKNEDVEILSSSSVSGKEIMPYGSIISFISAAIIATICMNNFQNIFLSEETVRKILLKPQEKTYKALLVLYLLAIGFSILFFNNVVIFNIPMSIFVLLLQIFYTILLIVIHPYRQSLRVHTITLLINQVVFIVFLFFINLINFFDDIDEVLVIMMGYFITGCCGFLMLLTAIRLYYELRYGEALEKQIQKEREQEEERQKKLEQEKLQRMKKKFELDAKNKQSQKEAERANNVFLYENQARQENAKDVIEWLDKCNWEAETKEKYFFSKFAQKPLDWLQKNSKEEFEEVMKMRRKDRQSSIKTSKPGQIDIRYQKWKEEVKKQIVKKGKTLKKELKEHRKKVINDMTYSMNIAKQGLGNFITHEYHLQD